MQIELINPTIFILFSCLMFVRYCKYSVFFRISKFFPPKKGVFVLFLGFYKKKRLQTFAHFLYLCYLCRNEGKL